MKKVTRAARLGGKRGIRTPGPVKINGFQDRRIRPLCHLSGCKGTTFFQICKIFSKKLKIKLIFYTFVGWKVEYIPPRRKKVLSQNKNNSLWEEHLSIAKREK